MQRANVTVSLPVDLLRDARHLAVDKGMSLSAFLAHLLEETVDADRRYREARDRQLALMAKGLPLGTEGKIPWTREDLHER